MTATHRCEGDLYTALAIASMAACLLAGQAAVAADFDGDGHDDLLLRHLHSDDWRYYTLVDDVPAEYELPLETEPVWRFVASGDFDGNGFDDVLVRRYDTLESGYHAVTADGVEVRPIRVTVNPLYDVLGAGDLDGDGADEILLRRNEAFGAWLYYDVDGSRVTLRRNFGPTQNLDFEFAALGDIDGDGTDDILARHRTWGHWIAYLMNGTSRAVLRRPRITQNLQFVLQGFADITGDGKADPLLRNVTSGEWIYYATGNRVGTGHPIAMRLQRGLGMPRETDWRFAAIGDYDGDGRATPMLRAPLTGEWRLHDIDGATSDEVRFPGLEAGLAWASVDTLPQGNSAELSRVELLQGPPVYRKDYRTGEVIGPVNASLPENGGDALEPWTWEKSRRHVIVDIFPAGPESTYWSADNRGFVTSLWGRRTALAIEALHPYAAPPPVMTAELLSAEQEAIPLAIIGDITEPSEGAGYRTETVFEIPAEHYRAGASVALSIGHDDGGRSESVSLFGEFVPPWIVRWFRLSTPDFPAPQTIDGQLFMEYIEPYTPMTNWHFGVAPEMVYEPTGQEPQGEVFEHIPLIEQIKMHQAKHACARETFVGVFDGSAMLRSGMSAGFIGGGSMDPFLTGTVGSMIDGGLGRPADISWPVLPSTFSHKVGHGFTLGHADCGDEDLIGFPAEDTLDPDYPYEGATLGPARGWDFRLSEFVDQVGQKTDIMGFCREVFVSDFHYQTMVLFRQSEHHRGIAEEAQACLSGEGAASSETRSLAVVGAIDETGTAAIVGVEPSTLPPRPSPDGGVDAWRISVTTGSGYPLHEESVYPMPVSHHENRAAAGSAAIPAHRLWSARIPLVAESTALIRVLDPSGAVRVEGAFRPSESREQLR